MDVNNRQYCWLARLSHDRLWGLVREGKQSYLGQAQGGRGHHKHNMASIILVLAPICLSDANQAHLTDGKPSNSTTDGAFRPSGLSVNIKQE